MQILYNKLVRDKIPDIIKANNTDAITFILDDNNYKKELLRKLNEECNEAISSKNDDELFEELADILEVSMSLCKLNNKSLNELIEHAAKKREEKGGFDKKIYLEKTISQ